MRFARSICVTVSLTLVPSLLHAAPAPANAGPVTTADPSVATSDPPVTTSPVESAPPVTTPPTQAAPQPATAPGGSVPVETEPPSRTRPRTWQIYQRPLPGAEHSWGPPNGQMPAVVEVSETPTDPNAPPPNGVPRIIIGAIVGTLGLGLFGLGVAAQTTDVLGENSRAGVPLMGGGLVTAAIGWGLFAHGILRRRAFLRWQGGQATVTPTLGGAQLLLRF